MRARFIPVASPSHPLHKLGRTLTYQDLRQHRQLVIRDSGSRRTDAGWLGAEQRWTVTNFATSIRAACQGMGFAWYPEDKIRDELEHGSLEMLPMREGQERFAEIYLIYTDRDYAGPATRKLGAIIQRRTKALCRERGVQAGCTNDSRHRAGEHPVSTDRPAQQVAISADDSQMSIRPARHEDAEHLAALINIAGEGIPKWQWQQAAGENGQW